MHQKPKVIFNWSGGKDSALCLHKLLQAQEYDVMCLLTTISEQYQRISMHGVRTELLEAQAERIGLSLVKVSIPEMPDMEVYNKVMSEALKNLQSDGAIAAVFGDIFLEDLREYREKKLAELNIKGIFPLWKIPTDRLIREFIDLGFKTIVSCVNEQYLDKSFAGRVIDYNFIADLPPNVDPCGEHGEFHTFVFDGPIFKSPIPIEIGEVVYRSYPAPKQDHSTDKNVMQGTYKESEDYGFWYCDLFSR